METQTCLMRTSKKWDWHHKISSLKRGMLQLYCSNGGTVRFFGPTNREFPSVSGYVLIRNIRQSVPWLKEQLNFGARFARSFDSAWCYCSYSVYCYYFSKHEKLPFHSESNYHFIQFKWATVRSGNMFHFT
jgi:hypothetical protein